MGITMPLAYLDSCIIIYLVEEDPLFAPAIENHLANHPNVIPAFSALSEMECLVMPLRQNNHVLVNRFRDWFQSAALYLPMERDIARQAAQLRATHTGLKTPDALHLATAQHYGCSEFWTNDDRLCKVAPLLARKRLLENLYHACDTLSRAPCRRNNTRIWLNQNIASLLATVAS